MRKLCVWFLLGIGACSEQPVLETGTVLQEARVCAAGATLEGIDVASYQGTIDWAAVKATGTSFAFIRASYGMAPDSAFPTNWAGAANAGITRGAYHFFRPAQDATAQADFFLQTVGPLQSLALPPVLDLEETDGLASATVVQAALVFLERVQQATGRTPILYTSPTLFSALGSPASLGSYVLWIASWGETCPNIPSPPWGTWTFWQYSATGKVAGIAADVDLNQFNGSLADLQLFLNPPLDAGQPGLDASTSEVDAATPGVDAAMPGVDGATPGIDAATPGIDAGSLGSDAGPTLDASARPDADEIPASTQSGCSCGVVAKAQSPGAVLLLALFALGTARRRKGLQQLRT